MRFETSFSIIRMVGRRVPGVITGDVGVVFISTFSLVLPRYDQTRTLAAEATGKVNEKVEPRPTVLSTKTSPPCNSINFLAIVRPRPVPPKRRVVLPSAWRNASKI